MLRRRSSSLIILPMLALLPALTLFACAGETTGDDLGGGVVQEPIPVDDRSLVGTYANSDVPTPGDLIRIVLEANGTVHTERLVECAEAACGPLAQDGLYRLLRQDTTTYLELDFGVYVDKYQYELAGHFLNIRLMSPSADGSWSAMLRSPESAAQR